jgi:hypothetical protein
VIADAIRIERIGDLSFVQIVDDGDSSFAVTVEFVAFAGQGYENDVHYAAAGTGSQTATWTFVGLTPGVYRVSVTWSEHPNRATNAPFTVFEGSPGAGIVRGTFAVNQQMAPSHLSADGVMWHTSAPAMRSTARAFSRCSSATTPTGTSLRTRFGSNSWSPKACK